MNTTINNLAELELFAQQLAASMKPGEVYGFSGELGAGKTTLVQAIGRAFGVPETMTSPTFVFRKEYEVLRKGITRLVHIDAYRIEGGSAEDLGPITEPDAVTLIEWPEKIPNLLPKDTKRVTIEIQPDESRVISLS